MDKNTDELEALLADSTRDNDSSGASDQKIETAKSEALAQAEASVRAEERIRELAEENKKLRDSISTQSSTDLDKFVDSIEDEPSRNLLKQYGSLLRKEFQNDIAPVKDDLYSSRFEKEFAMYEKIPELTPFKDELRKSFMRNPSQSLKALVGETLIDAQTSRIKPIDQTVSQASRTAPTVDDNTSKEDLYALLDQKIPL